MNNLPFQSLKPVKRPTLRSNDSILEALRDLSGGVGKTVAKDVAGKVASDALTSIFGSFPKQGEIRPNETINFPMERQPRLQVRHPEVHPVRNVVFHEDAKVKEQIEAIRIELKALSKSMQALNMEIQKAVMETPIKNPGVYHVTFYEKLRIVLSLLREQIDDSRTWLTMHTSRKKKIGYWGMFKKHGTTFGLSNERALATQAG